MSCLWFCLHRKYRKFYLAVIIQKISDEQRQIEGKIQLDRAPEGLIPLLSRVSGVITRDPKCNGGLGRRKLKPKLMKKLMSTCNGSGCDFHSIQGCSADKRLRGNCSLSFIRELRQKT